MRSCSCPSGSSMLLSPHLSRSLRHSSLQLTLTGRTQPPSRTTPNGKFNTLACRSIASGTFSLASSDFQQFNFAPFQGILKNFSYSQFLIIQIFNYSHFLLFTSINYSKERIPPLKVLFQGTFNPSREPSSEVKIHQYNSL